jgi:hypothetical protein
MHPGRRFRAGRARARVTAHGGGDDNFDARLHLLDLDTGQVRKELLDGIAQPDNDSSATSITQIAPEPITDRHSHNADQRRRDPAAEIITVSADVLSGDPIPLYRQVSRYG